MNDKTIDVFLFIFSIIVVALSFAQLIISIIEKKNKKEKNKKTEKSINISLFIVATLVVFFCLWSDNRKDITYEKDKKHQDSISNSQEIEIGRLKTDLKQKEIELEKEKQRTQSILDENFYYKKYRVNLMNQSSFGTLYILLDSLKRYAAVNDYLESNFYNNQFLSAFSYNNVALLGHYLDFTTKPSKETYFDIFEISFFQWYDNLYSGNWYVFNEEYSTFGGGSKSPIKLENSIIDGKTLIKKLSKNKALQYRKNVFETCRIILPPKTTLNVIQTRDYSPFYSIENHFKTEIFIKNNYFTITIKLDEKDFLRLDNNYHIGKLGFQKIVKKEDKNIALVFRAFAELKVNEDFVFNETSAKQYYWAVQFLKSIEKTFKD